jgi:hypothetical protein
VDLFHSRLFFHLHLAKSALSRTGIWTCLN